MLNKFLIQRPGLITFIHWGFIILGFIITYLVPFYIGIFMIILHLAHEKYFGGCYLTMMGRRAGQIKENEDFFHYFFRSVGLHISSKYTSKIVNLMKTIALLIVIYNFWVFVSG